MGYNICRGGAWASSRARYLNGGEGGPHSGKKEGGTVDP